MVKITLSLYRYFKSHQVVFYTILLVTTLFFSFFAFKINFEEDISTLLPSVEKGGTEKLVFSNLKVKDKIFLLFSSDRVSDPDELADMSDKFIERLLEKDSLQTINNILYRIDEEVLITAIQFLYENAPVFLDSTHYSLLAQLLTEEQVRHQMEENYQTLRSPAGMAFKDIIVQDPVALRKVFLPTGESGKSSGGNYLFYNSHIYVPDTTVLLAFLAPDFNAFDSRQGTRLIDFLENEITHFEQENPGVEILYHGAPVQSVYNSKRIKLDLLLTISVSLLLIFIILLICFKNKRTLLYLVIPVIYGVLFSLAVIYLIKGSMSLMAMGIGAIVMGVAFSYCLHVITHYKYVNDPEKVLKDQTVPVILGALTTIGAFMGLLLTKSELLRDFGLFASLGLVGTTLFCLFFLPQFFSTKNNRKSDKAFAFLEKINSYPFEKKRGLIFAILLVSAVCYFASGYVKFDSNLQNIGYNEKDVMRSRNLLASKTTGNFSTVYFAAVADDPDSAFLYSRQLGESLAEMKQAGLIKSYTEPSALFIPEEEQERRIERWNSFWTTAKKQEVQRRIQEAASTYKFAKHTFTPFFDMINAEYEPVSLMEAEIIPPEILDNIIESTDGRYMVFIPVNMERKNLEEVGKRVVDNRPDFVVVDPMYYTSDMVRMIHSDFDVTLAVSSLFVLLVLLFSYRSVILAFIAFLPMGLSWYIVLGTMAIFGMEFNLINIVISTFIFGIGVDYSIFIMDGLLSKYRTGAPLLVYHKTAIFFSAIILIIVVASLLFAVHPAIASIGVSTLIGMGATILIAYSLQPYLFSLLISGRAEKGKVPVSIRGLLSRNRKDTPENKLKGNYLYKGNKVENSLKRELRDTDHYALIRYHAKDRGTLLDYGCGSGFITYWAGLINPEMKIIAYDTDRAGLALAENGYLRTSGMVFTDSKEDLRGPFDVVVIQIPVPEEDRSVIKECCTAADVVIVKKAIVTDITDLLGTIGFNRAGEDKLYIAFSKN